MEARKQKGDMTLVLGRSGDQVHIRPTYREGQLPAGTPPNPHTITLSAEEFEEMLDQLDFGETCVESRELEVHGSTTVYTATQSRFASSSRPDFPNKYRASRVSTPSALHGKSPSG